MAYEECSQCTFVWPVLSTMLDMVCRYYDGCNINAAGSCVKFMADSLRHHSRDDNYISCRLVFMLTYSFMTVQPVCCAKKFKFHDVAASFNAVAACGVNEP